LEPLEGMIATLVAGMGALSAFGVQAVGKLAAGWKYPVDRSVVPVAYSR
jgi:hypothetical protein